MKKKIINNRFEIIEMIGKGGMGAVYRRGLVVKTKSESSLKCMSFNMSQSTLFADKPREACHIPSGIDAVSERCICL